MYRFLYRIEFTPIFSRCVESDSTAWLRKSEITRAHNNAIKFVEDIQSVKAIGVCLAQLQDIRFGLCGSRTEVSSKPSRRNYIRKTLTTTLMRVRRSITLPTPFLAISSKNYGLWPIVPRLQICRAARWTFSLSELKSYLSETLTLVEHIAVTNENYC